MSTNGEYVQVSCNDIINNVASRTTRGIGTVTSGYEPKKNVAVESSIDQASPHKFMVTTNGNISVSNATTSTANIGISNSILYPLI